MAKNNNFSKAKVRIFKNRELKPIKKFHWYLKSEFKNIKTILVEIQTLEDSGTDAIIKRGLIEYVIIKTVSIFEYFFKSFSHSLGLDISVQLDKVLKQGYDENRSKALVDSWSHSCPRSLSSMYKELLGRDIIKDAETYYDNFNNEGIEHEVYHIRRIPLLSKNWDNFYELFNSRNKIVHENISPSIKYSELRKMVGAVFDVMAISYWYRKT